MCRRTNMVKIYLQRLVRPITNVGAGILVSSSVVTIVNDVGTLLL